MKKDIEWLVKMINEELDILRQRLESGKGTSNQNTFDEGRGWALSQVLRMMYYPDKLEELSKKLPVIPKYVAEYLEYAKKHGSLIKVMELASISGDGFTMKKEYDWISANDEAFARAWLDGYTVEEEPLYHALIKGHELVDDYDVYWNYHKSNHDVFVSRLHPPLDNFTTEMTKQEWFEIGINDSNADFVNVDE